MPGQPAAPYEPAPTMPAPPRANPDDARNCRVLAVLADFFVQGLGVLAMVALFRQGDELAPGTWSIVGGTLGFFYYFVPQAVFGQTLGKALFDVRVVDEYGRQPGVGRIFLRTILLWIDYLLFIGPIAIILSGRGRRQRIGDMVAGTYVVRASQTPLGRGPDGAIAAVSVALALLPAALIMSPAHAAITEPDVAWRANHTANAYLTAAINGDTATACRLMSSGEKRAIVARGLDAYVAAASDADCRRLAAPFLKRDAKRYAQAGGPPIELTRPWDGTIYAMSGAQPVVGLSRDGDDWKVDQVAGIKAGFVRGCDLTAAGRFAGHVCGCIFDELRGRGYESEDQFMRVVQVLQTGGRSDDLVAAAQTCAPNGP
jgi:uncharacterized RDD family membrane protein YckC